MTKTIFEYVWLDVNDNFRSKSRVIDYEPSKTILLPEELPTWNYDGSSTGQATGSDSEVFLIPRAIFRNPFYNHTSYLVWCDWVNDENKALINCTRPTALEIFTKYIDMKPWFGLEQEYFIIDPETRLPLGLTPESEPQGKYYCGVGCDRVFGRNLVDKHFEYCLNAGIKICGINGEVAPAQWEFQIGICEGIEAGDHLWMARYILNRLAESMGYIISYHPKPLGSADWNGSGCHTNFSTQPMRDPDGLKQHIHQALDKLCQNHKLHMEYYGKHNRLRMSGIHETSNYDQFTYGVANRGASVRIPHDVLKKGCGYFEDRRPAANCDPYLVTSLIMETTSS